MAALLSGQGVNEVARDLKVHKSTVSRIKAELDQEKLQQVGTQKKERLIDLIEGHLKASLTAAMNLASMSNDKTWLRSQSAGELAVFYGVLSDKSFKLLEAAGAAIGESEQRVS